MNSAPPLRRGAIFAIGSAASYDDSIRQGAARGQSHEGIIFDLALQDLTQAADLFLPVVDGSDGADGWVSLEVAPLLAADTAGTGEPIGGIKVNNTNGWFAARPPGTESIYNACAESLTNAAHLQRIVTQAHVIVDATVSTGRP